MFKKILSATLCLIFSFGACFAHHPGIGISGSGATCSTIVTITPETLPRCNWTAGIQEQFIKFDSWSTETLELKAKDHPDTDIETLDYISQTSLFFGYGICDNFMLTLSLPYLSFTEIRHAEPLEVHPDEFEVHNQADEFEVHNQGDSNGLGDLNLLFTWKFLQNDNLNTSAAFLFGVTLPTGRTDIKDIHGERFEGDHQPGSGSINPLVGLAASKKWEQSAVYANIFYTNRTKGAHHTCLGDIFNYNFSLAHQIKLFSKTKSSPHNHDYFRPEEGEHSHTESHEKVVENSAALDVLLELSGTVDGKDYLDGEINTNSGGHSLFLYPGLRILSGTKGLSCAYVSLGLPIYQDLNGSQTKNRFQILFGIVTEF